MTPRSSRLIWLLAALWIISGASSPAAATTITFPAVGGPPPTFELPANPANPNFPGLTTYTINLGALYAQAFPGVPSPNPLPTILFAENELTYMLVMFCCMGPGGLVDPVVADQTLSFLITGTFWSVFNRLEIDPASGPILANDIITLSGDAVHRVAPHPGELAPGPNIPFRIELHGGRAVTLPPDFSVPGGVPADALARLLELLNQIPGARTGFDFNTRLHGSHEDLVFGFLAGQVANPGIPLIANRFEFYAGGTAGLHTPEHSTLVLVGVGLLALVVRARRFLS